MGRATTGKTTKAGGFMKLQRIRAGYYRHENYTIERWYPESKNPPVLWCVAQIHEDGKDRTALEDFKTLNKAKQYLTSKGS
jgi:hypothetical protein